MVYRTTRRPALNLAATKIKAAFRGFKQRRAFRGAITRKRTREAHTRNLFWNGSRNSRGVRHYGYREGIISTPVPRAPHRHDVGYSPAPVRITRAMRARMFRHRAAADYKYYTKTNIRRDILRGGAFFH